MHAYDRQTDGQTEFSSLDRVCILCSAVSLRYKYKYSVSYYYFVSVESAANFIQVM